ncbi:MAG: hypothetical protein AB7F32_03590, partial [Victivallaceae bacterium]
MVGHRGFDFDTPGGRDFDRVKQQPGALLAPDLRELSGGGKGVAGLVPADPPVGQDFELGIDVAIDVVAKERIAGFAEKRAIDIRRLLPGQRQHPLVKGEKLDQSGLRTARAVGEIDPDLDFLSRPGDGGSVEPDREPVLRLLIDLEGQQAKGA